MHEVIEEHDRIFHLLSEESFFEKIIEFDTIEYSDDKNIDDIITIGFTKIEYSL